MINATAPAVARVKLFPPEALLTRLEQRLHLLTGGACDLPVRQQTLRNAIAWSYDLLGEGEKTLFARLGVFVGAARWRRLRPCATQTAICRWMSWTAWLR